MLVGSLAPLGGGPSSVRPGSGSSSASDNRGSGSSLGSLTQLGSTRPNRSPPPVTEDLDDGLDALLSGGGPATATHTTASTKSSSTRHTYESDSGSDVESTKKGKKKKDKKSSKDKKKDKDRDRDTSDRDKRSGGPLSSSAADTKRKSNTSTHRPTTAPVGDGFDDDALFGLGVKPTAPSPAVGSINQRSAMNSRSNRRSPTDDTGGWDEPEDSQHQDDVNIDPDDLERSAPSTARSGTRGSSANSTNTRAAPVAQLAEDFFATQKLHEEAPPVTFGSRRARGATTASATPPSADSHTAVSASPPTTVPAAATPVVAAPPPSAVFMPGDDEPSATDTSINSPTKPSPPTLTLKELMAKKRAEARRLQEEQEIVAAAEREAEEEIAAVQAQAKAPKVASVPVSSKRNSAFDDLPDPSLDDGIPPISSGASPSHMDEASPSDSGGVGSDPFGSMLDTANPMDEIDEKQGNIFSGFGDHRPASSMGGPAPRQRRNLATGTTVGGSTTPTPPISARGATAPAAKPAVSVTQQQPKHPATPSAGGKTGTTVAAGGPKGPVSVSKPSVDDWIGWLGLSRSSGKDIKLLCIAEAAATTRVPSNWSVVNGYWVNSKKAKGSGAPAGTKHERHPLLRHFLAKLDNKRLALQYNIADDDDEADESIIASGDEEQPEQGGHSPSSINRSISLLDDSLNPLSPVGNKKKDLSAGFAAATAANNAAATAASQTRPSTSVSSFTPAGSVGVTPTHGAGLAVNTTPAITPHHGHANTTPSPYAGLSHFNSSPAASPPSTGAGSGANLPVGSPEPPSKSPSYTRLARVPEGRGGGIGSTDNSIGSMEDLLAAQRAKAARLAEQERLSQERILAASTQSVGSYEGTAADGARIAELLTQIRMQSITIEELEKRKRALAFELENADAHLAALLGEQRARFQTQTVEAERRAHAEQESLRAALARSEASHQSHTHQLEDRIANLESRRATEVAQAISQTETHARELAEHTLKIHAQQLEATKQHYERELESTKLLHSNEVASLQAQASSSVFLRSLVSQVESSAANLDSLSKKVYQERSASERLTFEQLQVRDRLLNEKETSLEQERRHCDDLLNTFKKMQREHEEDKIRLKEEHTRLSTLQQDVQNESALLKDQLIAERDQLRKERALVQQQRDAWEIKYKRENADLDLKRELIERQHGQETHQFT
jgi:uncharacterized coiled-coil protein SlyX